MWLQTRLTSVFWAINPKQWVKRGNACHLHAAWQGPASEVRTPGAPDPVVRDGHPAIVTFTHKQRVLHLLTRAVIIWKRPSTAHRLGELESGSTSSSDSSIANSRCSSSGSIDIVKLFHWSCSRNSSYYSDNMFKTLFMWLKRVIVFPCKYSSNIWSQINMNPSQVNYEFVCHYCPKCHL